MSTANRDSTSTSSEPTPAQPPPLTASASPRRRPWLRWAILALAGIGVAALFITGPNGQENEAASSAKSARGGNRGPGGQSGRGGKGSGARPTPVSAALVEIGSLAELATYPGELHADAADVAANVSGRLEAVNVRIGDRVTQGQELGRVNIAELARQRAETAAQAGASLAAKARAVVELEAAQRELERADGLAAKGLISAQQLDTQRARTQSLEASVQVAEAQRAQAIAQVATLDQRLTDSRIRAPFAGVIAARYHDPGSFVQTGTPVVRLVAREPLRVRFEVPERDVGQFGTGATFRVRAPPTGNQELSGQVTGVAAEVDRQRRVVRVEGIIENAPESWLPGMFAEVITPLRSLDSAIIVPAAALVTSLQEGGAVATGVFRVDGQSARWVPVEVSARSGDRAAIAPQGTLEAGAQVLVGGHVDLADGAPIVIADGLTDTRKDRPSGKENP